ncbi:hypothetical protein D1AOALGA4SA_5928 [Olavius algarvensis Delta 1 endosymbiont]|nr:hypothetical protein D1AOALGA4SA_5928 [Olavius algarvensis Delta 1 endosymbiont]
MRRLSNLTRTKWKRYLMAKKAPGWARKKILLQFMLKPKKE